MSRHRGKAGAVRLFGDRCGDHAGVDQRLRGAYDNVAVIVRSGAASSASSSAGVRNDTVVWRRASGGWPAPER